MPSLSDKSVDSPSVPSTSVLFCELCHARNSHTTKQCPQIRPSLVCSLCDMQNAHMTKDCPLIATRVTCGDCGELGHPRIMCTKRSKPVQ